MNAVFECCISLVGRLVFTLVNCCHSLTRAPSHTAPPHCCSTLHNTKHCSTLYNSKHCSMLNTAPHSTILNTAPHWTLHTLCHLFAADCMQHKLQSTAGYHTSAILQGTPCSAVRAKTSVAHLTEITFQGLPYPTDF